MNIFVSTEKKTPIVKVAVNMLLLTCLVVGIFWYSLMKIGVTFDFGFITEMRVRLVDGFLMTFSISVLSLVVSLIIGVTTAIFQSSKILLLRYWSEGYVTLIRGTPLIMQIYLFFYIVGTAFGIDNRFVCGVLILSIFEGAYIAEIIRGSILSIEASQIEASKAVGFTKKQMIQHVILPQLFARTLPALTGQFASIIKDSSLLSMIAIIELTQTMREISAMNLKLFECYLFLGVLYLCLTLPVSLISKWLEGRFRYEN
ncbi:MAG: amino acid ABC transporter permease [Eubacteriales bacterium]